MTTAEPYMLAGEEAAIEHHHEPARPVWAAAVIVAERQVDHSDMMTDYFNVRSEGRPVILAYSRHTRDNFAEMRKAAATFPPTAHLGPGRGRFRLQVVVAKANPDGSPLVGFHSNCTPLYPDNRSHWHGDAEEFETRAQAEAYLSLLPAPEPISFDGRLVPFVWQLTGSEGMIEHREKYSMGHGYYLKASSCYSTGWAVRKNRLPS